MSCSIFTEYKSIIIWENSRKNRTEVVTKYAKNTSNSWEKYITIAENKCVSVSWNGFKPYHPIAGVNTTVSVSKSVFGLSHEMYKSAKRISIKTIPNDCEIVLAIDSSYCSLHRCHALKKIEWINYQLLCYIDINIELSLCSFVIYTQLLHQFAFFHFPNPKGLYQILITTHLASFLFLGSKRFKLHPSYLVFIFESIFLCLYFVCYNNSIYRFQNKLLYE
jgi:hypothetical protein